MIRNIDEYSFHSGELNEALEPSQLSSVLTKTTTTIMKLPIESVLRIFQESSDGSPLMRCMNQGIILR
jgi:hypothetical protein